MYTLPLSTSDQERITSKELARIIIDLLIRNDSMEWPSRRLISYYPYGLSAIRSFEIIGHSNPERPEFARKWNEAVRLLESKAFIAPDPAQDTFGFVIPTSFATREELDKHLGKSVIGANAQVP
jgi:hypothetical protein